MEKIKEKCRNFIRWIRGECEDWKTWVIFILVAILIYFPVWGGYLLYWIFKWKWCIVMATTSLVFWAGPFTPFFPVCIAVTFFIKGIVDFKK